MAVESDYKDKTVMCKECGRDFIWTAGEQLFYADKGMQQPKRCKDCRARRKLIKTETSSYSTDGADGR